MWVVLWWFCFKIPEGDGYACFQNPKGSGSLNPKGFGYLVFGGS
jgi:hypothetical protein